MPYTPPSQLSPATSKQSTPAPSRSPSYVAYNAHPDFTFPPTNTRPSLPRSAGSSSYLTKHRRSPSTPTGNEIPAVMSDMQRGILFDPHGSLRQSPPPRTNGIIPSGMTISPPESQHNSDDEETRGRPRELEKENLAELHAAIRGIRGERRSGSPTRTQTTVTVSGKSASEGSSPTEGSRPPLSSSQRKISHSRSSTDSNIVFDPKPVHVHSYSQSQPELLSPKANESDSDESDIVGGRPPMVRKKSGELVKPALRPHSRRRPSSMPGTPTYSKAVHFDSQLEHIRHFLQVDRPLAVSAGSSPVENYESETEFPFGSDEAGARSRGPSYEWEIRLANFPAESAERKMLPIHVDRVFLSADKKNLIGVVAVQNLAFEKRVTARFTLDYWKTTSEVSAEYSNDVRRTTADNADRFTFSISLADQVNLENKTLFFCVRYNVNGQEYWDSNNMINYQVDFTKKPRTKAGVPQQQNGLGARPLNALPRSRPSPPTSAARPKSMPISFDDFGSGLDNFGLMTQSPTSIIGEPKMKLRSPRSKQELVPDAPARRNKSAAPMFGTRYDFNSSLSAAKSNAYAVLGESSGLQAVHAKQSPREVPGVVVGNHITPKLTKLENGTHNEALVTTAPAVGAPLASSKPATLLSEKPSLSSQSYQELVDKYCFFGSVKATPVQGKQSNVTADSTADNRSDSDGSNAGSASSSGSSSPLLDDILPTPRLEVPQIRPVAFSTSRSASPSPFQTSWKDSRSNSPQPFAYSFASPTSDLLARTPQTTTILG